MGVGTTLPTRTITITYKDDTEEDFQIIGKFWTFATFLCFHRVGAEVVTYIPLDNVRYVEGQAPS
jgi:hypothetical protein